MKFQRSIHLLTALALSSFGAACSDSTSPGTETASVSLSFFVPQAPPAQVLFDGPQGAITQGDGLNTLTLTRVAMVVREIELHREFAVCDDSFLGDSDECEEFETGPFLAELPLDGTMTTAFSVVVPDGTYDQVDFTIHKPSDDLRDVEFLLANPDFDGVSIRVEGTYNGEPFLFLQDLNEEQEIALLPPVTVDATTDAINVTLAIDVSNWFVNQDGTLIDPVTANVGNDLEGVVEENIKLSIDAFEDDDRDGVSDDDVTL